MTRSIVLLFFGQQQSIGYFIPIILSVGGFDHICCRAEINLTCGDDSLVYLEIMLEFSDVSFQIINFKQTRENVVNIVHSPVKQIKASGVQ